MTYSLNGWDQKLQNTYCTYWKPLTVIWMLRKLFYSEDTVKYRYNSKKYTMFFVTEVDKMYHFEIPILNNIYLRSQSPYLSIPSTLPPWNSLLSGCCLNWSRAEWGDLASFLDPQSHSFFPPRAHMVMHQISALCDSPRQETSSTLDWCALAAPCVLALSAKGDDRENREREREREHEELRGNDFLHRLCGPGKLFICVFKSIGENKRRDCAIYCLREMLSLYIFKPPLFHA